MIAPCVVRQGTSGHKFVVVRQLGPGRDPWRTLPQNRLWDLVELYFDKAQFDACRDASEADTIVFDAEPSRRKLATVKWLAQHGTILEPYDLLCLADDDVEPVHCWSQIFTRFAEAAAHEGIGIGQPALTRESYFSHVVTLQVPQLKYRVTDFVEVMCPIFTRKSFGQVVNMFDATSSGWSVDDAWMHALHEGIIVDAAPVVHNRPLGKSYSMGAAAMEATEFRERTGTPMASKVTLRHGPRVAGVSPAACWICLQRNAQITLGSVPVCRSCLGAGASAAIAGVK